MKYHLENVNHSIGLVVDVDRENDLTKLLVRTATTSDSLEFYQFAEQIIPDYLSQCSEFISLNYINHCVILIHEDSTADIYTNEDVIILIEAKSKHNKQKGDLLYKSEITDIRDLRFDNITIHENDDVIICIKVGWRFALLVDVFRERGVLDIPYLFQDLTRLYKNLSYKYLYDHLKKPAEYLEMLKDGWFPFLEIIGSEFEELTNIYSEKKDSEQRKNNILNKFDKVRIDEISSKWWSQRVFEEKKALIESGLKSFLDNNPQGFISAIKILSSEIEGVLSLSRKEELNSYTTKSEPLSDWIAQKPLITKSSESFYLPVEFKEYLQNSLFISFDVMNDDVDISRHTVNHGVAKAEDYTKERALELILTLDQIYYYLCD